MSSLGPGRTFGVPPLRTVAFLIGFGAQLTMLLRVFALA